MKIQEVNAAMDKLKESCGDGLVMSSVISFQYGQSIAGYNSSDKADALLAKFTAFVVESMSNCSFGKVGDYYAIKMKNDFYSIVVILHDYCWAGIINTNKVPFGMIMNVILPECISDFKLALS